MWYFLPHLGSGFVDRRLTSAIGIAVAHRHALTPNLETATHDGIGAVDVRSTEIATGQMGHQKQIDVSSSSIALAGCADGDGLKHKAFLNECSLRFARSHEVTVRGQQRRMRTTFDLLRIALH